MSMRNQELDEGEEVGRCRVQYNDWRHLYVVNGRIIPLSPTEYRMVMQLYWQVVRVQRGEQWDGFVSFEELGRSLVSGESMGSHRCVTRHMSNVRLKMEAATPFHIGCDGTLGYILVPRPRPGDRFPLSPVLA